MKNILFLQYKLNFLQRLVFYFFILFILKSSASSTRPTSNTPKSFLGRAFQKFWWAHRDARYDNFSRVTTPLLLEKFGFGSETHHVTTDDLYILTLHRILPENPNQKKPVVLFVPGLFGCSDSWLANTPQNNLALKVAPTFDVWMLNPRGCFYSRQHKILSRTSQDFWNFSWHEIGVEDLSATIDYILMVTGQPSLNIIGLSMGTTVTFVLLSSRPEYNEKVNMSIALGPVAYVKESIAPIKPILKLAGFLPSLGRAIPGAVTGGSMEMFPRNDFTRRFLDQICGGNSTLASKKVCLAQFFAIVGFDSCQFDMSLLPTLLDVYPAGASVWSLIHYFQIGLSNKFRPFDFGLKGNLKKYKGVKPPKYNLKNVRAPHTFFWAENDWMAHPSDISRLAGKLGRDALKETCRVKFRRFNHFDYTMAKDVNLLLNERVVRVLHGESCHLTSIDLKIGSGQNEVEKDDYEDEESIQCPAEAEIEDVTKRSWREIFRHTHKLLRKARY